MKFVDTVPTLDILFIIVISITAVSVFLSIVDWVYLASLASKTTLLEREVEKKSLEFDAIKKERYAAQNSSEGSASVIESNEPTPGSTLPSVMGSDDTIQIVRNVRGNFEQTEPYIQHIQDFSPQPPVFRSPSPSNSAPHEYPDHYETVSQVNRSQKLPDNRLQPSIETDKFSLPPVGSDNSSDAITMQQHACILKLYSETTKDADFQTLWKEITAQLQTRQNPHIIIDLAGINFMYDKEMDYLEKIKCLLAGRGGSLGFINCDHELLALFDNRPQLRSIVQQKAL